MGRETSPFPENIISHQNPMSKRRIVTDVLLLITLALDIVNAISSDSVVSTCLFGMAAFALVVYFVIEISEVIHCVGK